MIIYKITNNINGKIYIGQTTQSLANRWSQHTKEISKCFRMKAAIKKYGKESFSIEEIDKYLSVIKAWIQSFWVFVYRRGESWLEHL